MKRRQQTSLTKQAFWFVVTIGIVNLFGDVTYEGARSITGPFLESLGASALAVAVIAGGGELFGYVLRFIAGYFADKTQKYWWVTIAGYVLNTTVVPALALAGSWPVAAALIMAERTGRGIRKPSTDAMISYAGKSIGRGWVFGINENLDQVGATLGPTINDSAIALFYAGAMASAAITNLGFGRLFDRIGFPIAAGAFLLGAFFAPFVFLGQFWVVLIGVVLWGIGMGAQNSLLKAMLSSVIPVQKRSTGFGLFYAVFGVAWFLGSAAMGFLYDHTIAGVIMLSMILQLLALPFFVWARTQSRSRAESE